MPANTDLSSDPLVEQSSSALEAMEAEAAEFFAARAASQNAGDGGLNPIAPALEKAVETAKPPAKEAAKPTAPAAKPTGKVPGAPTLPKAAAKSETETPATDKSAEKPASDPAEPDLSDTPRTFRPGLKAANWDKLHAAIDHHKSAAATAAAERDALRAELEAAKASASTAPEVQQRLAALQQERDALRSQLETVAGERIFDAEAKPRREAEILAAKDAVGPELAKTVEELLSMQRSPFRDAKLAEIAESLPVLQRDELLAAARALNRLDLERTRVAAQGGALWNQRMAQQQAAQEKINQERIARANSTFDSELKEWASVGLSAEDVANARSVYSGQGATLQDAARASLWAVKGPQIAQLAQTQQERIAELEGELAKLRSAQPGVGAAASGSLPTSGDDDDDGGVTGYAEAIARKAMRGGVRFGV